LQLRKQPHVFDRDDRLVRERLEQRDLLGRERPALLSGQSDCPDRITVSQHRHAQRDAETGLDEHALLVLRVLGDVNVDDGACEDRPAGGGASVRGAGPHPPNGVKVMRIHAMQCRGVDQASVESEDAAVDRFT
jgi:hypothetical protein